MCVDYRPLNSATVKDQTPLPSHTDLRDRVRDCPYLTKLDIRDAFHMIKIDVLKLLLKLDMAYFNIMSCLLV